MPPSPLPSFLPISPPISTSISISTPLLLTTLPPELRTQIYAHALGGRAFHIFTSHHGLSARPYVDGISNVCTCLAIRRRAQATNPTGTGTENWHCKLVRPRKDARLKKERFLDLLCVCRQIYFEARLILYTHTDFHILDPAALLALQTTWSPDQVASIRSLTLALHFQGTRPSPPPPLGTQPQSQTQLQQKKTYYRRLAATRKLQAHLLTLRGLRALRLVCHVRACTGTEEDTLCALLRELVVRMPGVLTLDFGHGYGDHGEPVGVRAKLSVALGMGRRAEEEEGPGVGVGVEWENLRCVEGT